MVACDIRVFLIVREELCERALAVDGLKFSNLERVTHPVERGRLAQHRATTAILHAADQLELRIVVRRLRILAHVKSRETSRAPGVRGVTRAERKPHAV